MPEPALGESVTDIDGTQAGELEIDLTALGGRTGGANHWEGSIEVEGRVTDRLGVEIGVGYARALVRRALERELELRLLAAWSLLHDFERGLHGQVEIAGRLLGEPDSGPNLGEPRAPISAGFRLGLDQGWWTLRLGLGAAGGGGSAHLIPAWASATGFLNFGHLRWGSLGLDGEADWTRGNPFALAPTLLLDGRVLRIPARLALVAPYGFPGGGAEPWFGLLLRLIGEFDLGPGTGE